jgi:hypothetical protein
MEAKESSFNRKPQTDSESTHHPLKQKLGDHSAETLKVAE